MICINCNNVLLGTTLVSNYQIKCSSCNFLSHSPYRTNFIQLSKKIEGICPFCGESNKPFKYIEEEARYICHSCGTSFFVEGKNGTRNSGERNAKHVDENQSDENKIDNQKYNAFLHVLKTVSSNSAKSVTYTIAALGLAALIPHFRLPPELIGIAGGLGVNALGNILDRVAGNEISENELKQEIEKIAEKNTDDLLTRDSFYHAFTLLRSGQRHLSKQNQEILAVLNSADKEANVTQPKVVIGAIEWTHKSSCGVETVDNDGISTHHSITFTRPIDNSYEPEEDDFLVEFDITSYSLTEVRIMGVDIEVKGWKPIKEKIVRSIPYLGLSEKRNFFCEFGNRIGIYPSRFEFPDKYIKLSRGELEFIELHINTPNEGIYDLAVSIRYSTEGKVERLTSETKKGLWFISGASLSRRERW